MTNKERLLNTLKLVQRSPKDIEGWSKCSDVIFSKIIQNQIGELIEHKLEGGINCVRLTDKAETLLEYA